MAKLSRFESVCKNYFSSFEYCKLPFDSSVNPDLTLKYTFGIYSYECEFNYVCLDNNLKMCVVFILTYKNGIYLRVNSFNFFTRNYIDNNFSSFINNIFNLED